jgi:hypothetical protein
MSEDYANRFASARDRIFALLSDCQWHTRRELQAVGGIRYGARLLELKRMGYRIEAADTGGDEHGRDYRLLSTEPNEPQAKRVKALLEEQDVVSLLRGDITLTASAALRNALGSFRANRGKL